MGPFLISLESSKPFLHNKKVRGGGGGDNKNCNQRELKIKKKKTQTTCHSMFCFFSISYRFVVFFFFPLLIQSVVFLFFSLPGTSTHSPPRKGRKYFGSLSFFFFRLNDCQNNNKKICGKRNKKGGGGTEGKTRFCLMWELKNKTK